MNARVVVDVGIIEVVVVLSEVVVVDVVDVVVVVVNVVVVDVVVVVETQFPLLSSSNPSLHKQALLLVSQVSLLVSVQ